MRVVHPRAIDDDEGPPPASVDIRGDTVTLDDEDTFECTDEGWLQQFAAAYGVDLETITVDSPSDADRAIANGDAEAFVDRTPVEDVAGDIRNGTVDGVLDEIEAAEEADRDRTTVHKAIEARRAELAQQAVQVALAEVVGGEQLPDRQRAALVEFDQEAERAVVVDRREQPARRVWHGSRGRL
jgi:hypothetical protein